MFFTKAGYLFACFIFGVSLFALVSGVGIAILADDPDLIARKYFNASNTGKMIDAGLRYIGLSLALGVLAEISAHLFESNESN